MVNYSKVVDKPIQRGGLRKYLGKKYFILKRRLQWLMEQKLYAKEQRPDLLPYKLIKHQSLLLRPLKDVEMEYQYNKITNLKLAVERINNLIIKPGETFSFWYLVGSPTKNKGYLKGLVLKQGKIDYDYGGGLCQLGNLLYWMALHTPLTVKERWRHSYDVFPDINRTLPFGSGATLSYNYIDLQFKNETDRAFQLHLSVSDKYLHGEILSDQPSLIEYTVYEAEHFFKQEFWGGYTRHNVLRRKLKDKLTGAEVGDEVVTMNHAIMMYSPMIAE